MNEPTDRREFLRHAAAAAATGSALLWAGGASAQVVMVSEKDATAAALGYIADTQKVDARKFPQHNPRQRCAGCHLYTGRAGDGAGACGIFPGKSVAAQGWCSAYVPKA